MMILRQSIAMALMLAITQLPVGTAGAQGAVGSASADDTARFLAGIAPTPQSPLTALTQQPVWQQHAKFYDAEWASQDRNQLAKVRAFAATHLKSRAKTLFYTFSGPDILYAEAFFPKAETYILAGLEPIGAIPDLGRLRTGGLAPALAHLKASLTQVLGRSYFITLDMDKHLRQGQLPGVLPVLYVFLARAGKTIRTVEYMRLDPEGMLQVIGETPIDRPRVARITFAAKDGPEQTLYYLTNLDNDGVAKSGFLRFCAGQGAGDSFVKSASYLMHGSQFSSVREFLLANSSTILQDDTGPPLSFFKPEQWNLQPFGRYTTPIPVFARNYQPKLKELFDRSRPPPFDFSLGYRWRPGQ